MANEIQITTVMQVNKGLLSYSQIPGTALFDMTGTKSAGGAQAAAITNGVAIDLNTLTGTTVGYAYFRNTSTTVGENIQIGTGLLLLFVPFMELKPREMAILRINSSGSGTVPTFRSLTGTPVLQYWIAET
jgi:hypothetical protein